MIWDPKYTFPKFARQTLCKTNKQMQNKQTETMSFHIVFCQNLHRVHVTILQLNRVKRGTLFKKVKSYSKWGEPLLEVKKFILFRIHFHSISSKFLFWLQRFPFFESILRNYFCRKFTGTFKIIITSEIHFSNV